MNGSTLSELPKGPFSIIYADPPWGFRTPPMGSGSAAVNHYPLMRDEDICAIPVVQCAADDALLFLWATSPELPAAFKVGEAWGFRFVTVGFVWYKHLPVVGNYTMSECELCLIFRRGRIPKPRGARNIRQFLSERRTAHSAKPPEFRKRIEAMFPTQSKLELFARAPAEGWTVWGNEADGNRIHEAIPA